MSIKRNKNLMSRNHSALKRSKKDIEYIVIHYVGALGDAYDNTEYYKNNSIDASADFWVGHDGDVWQGNDYYNYYAWHCGGGRQSSEGGSVFGLCKNSNSIGIEMCVKKASTSTMNATDTDWYFTEKTIKATVELVQDLMMELDIDIDHVVRHFDVTGKYCPNPFLDKYHPGEWDSFKSWIEEGSLEKEEPKTDEIWMGWTKRETGSAGLRCIHGDSGKAYGLQFDYRYGLVPFMEYCVSYNKDRYSGFKQYISLGAGNSGLIYNEGLGRLWQNYYDAYTEEFCQLQYTCAYQSYYLPAKSYLMTHFGIDLDAHSPALKGSVWSMAFRSGSETGAKKYADCTNGMADEVIMVKAYGTYGSQDGGRWTQAGQLGDALRAYAECSFQTVYKDMSSIEVMEEMTESVVEVASVPQKQYYVQAGFFYSEAFAKAQMERVKAAGFDCIVKNRDGGYSCQCGLFSIKSNAEKLKKQLQAKLFNAIVKEK